MKNLFKTMLFGLLIPGTIVAQNVVNDSKITQIQTFTNSKGEIFTVKTITEEMQPLLLNPKDEGKINQRVVESPVHVDKTILIDNDNDAFYEKEVTLSYTKDLDDELNYIATANGVFFKDANDMRLVSKVGTYSPDVDEVEDITVTVEEVSTLK